MRFSLLFFYAVFAASNAYKFLVYSPLFGHSHTTFMATIADVLTAAGHDVTVFMPILQSELSNKTGLKLTKKTIFLPPSPEIEEYVKADQTNRNRWIAKTSPLSFMKMTANMSIAFKLECDHVLSQTELIAKLRAEKFDVAIAEPIFACSFGFFDILGITKTIGADSTVRMDTVANYIGQPLGISYVPGMMSSSGPEMGLSERIKNILGIAIGEWIFSGAHSAEEEVMIKHGITKSAKELLGGMSYMFLNSNPYLNFPMPTLHKIVDVGGITVERHLQKVAEIDEEWDKILSERIHNVFISFGSMAKSVDMPDEYKNSMIKMFETFPDVTFVWKYEEPSNITKHLDNVYLSSWLPQNVLLADKRLSIFITHGGLGSTTEVAYFGKPSIMIPLFGDQPRNVKMLCAHGGALALQKTDMGNVEILVNAIRTVLNDPSYAENARNLAETLRNKPLSNSDLLVKHAEYAARYGPLTQLDAHGRHLNFIQYYFIDALFILALTVSVVILVFYCFVRLAFRTIFAKNKEKVE